MRGAASMIAVCVVAGGCATTPAGRGVPITVVTAPGGATQALVAVFVDDEGPLVFVVDTGAAESLIDIDTVVRLGLRPVAGSEREVTGLDAATDAVEVDVGRWRMGDVDLPRTRVVSVDIAQPTTGTQIDGLLGSDVLSTFGTVTIDYDDELLVVGA